MTNKKVVGLVAAVVLAAIGTFLLRSYMNGLETRVLAELDSIEVYVVTATIPAGTASADIGGSVQRKMMPASAHIDGTVNDLEEVRDLVVAADLLPGEQLLRARFELPEAFAVAGRADRGLVPSGLQEVTVALTSERALGGRISPGERVGVVVSLTDTKSVQDQAVQSDGTSVPVTITNEEPVTFLRFDQVLVSYIQITETVPSDAINDDDETEFAQPGAIFVTLAVDAEVAARLVYAAEFGSIWLTRQVDEDLLGSADVITQDALLDGRRRSLGTAASDEPIPQLDATNEEQPGAASEDSE